MLIYVSISFSCILVLKLAHVACPYGSSQKGYRNAQNKSI